MTVLTFLDKNKNNFNFRMSISTSTQFLHIVFEGKLSVISLEVRWRGEWGILLMRCFVVCSCSVLYVILSLFMCDVNNNFACLTKK